MSVDFTSPPQRLPGDPWSRWVLFALYRHLDRQAWVGKMAERAGASLARVGRLGEHPEPGAGTIPGEPKWRFRFHGRGCVLMHEDGTVLDVDFVHGTTEWIDPYFYNLFLKSVPSPEFPEARLRRVGPLENAWEADLEVLLLAKLIERDHVVRLTESGLELARHMARVWTNETDASRAAAAWQLDDAALALEQLGSNAPASVRARATEQEEGRVALLEALLVSRPRAAFIGLADLGERYASPHVEQVLRGANRFTESRVLDIVRSWGDAKLAPFAFECALNTNSELSRVQAALTALTLWKASEVTAARRVALLEALERCESKGSRVDAALLITRLEPERGLAKLRACLGEPDDNLRESAACALGVVMSPAAISVLREAETEEAIEVLKLLRGEESELASRLDRKRSEFAALWR